MSFLEILTTLFELAMVAALFWCFFHEDRLIAFERRLFAPLRRRRLRVVRTATYHTARRVRQ